MGNCREELSPFLSNKDWNVVYDLGHRKEGVDRMRTRHYKKIMAVLIIGLFVMQLIPARPVMAAFDQKAYYNDIGKKLEDMANKYNIPPVLLKAIAYMESGWN